MSCPVLQDRANNGIDRKLLQHPGRVIIMSDDSGQATVTRLLRQLSAGDRDALNALYPLVYDELRALAHAQRRHRGETDTLDTTALVHEAYLKLVGQEHPRWHDHPHFCAVAATAMRHLRIDHARRAHAARRGGRRVRLSLEQVEHSLAAAPDASPAADDPELLVLLDEALRKLESVSERQARIVECRFFAAMTVQDTAAALSLSTATVKRGWSMAQAWLHREMERALARGAAEGTA